MSSDELDKLREEVIEKIKRAFPKHWQPKGKQKLIRAWSGGYEADRLRELLEDKNWQDVVGTDIVYYLSDPDYYVVLTDRAYAYYLPAFLVATLNEPDRWDSYTYVLDKIVQIAQKSSAAKVEALIAWLEFQKQYHHIEDDILQFLPPYNMLTTIEAT